MSPIYVVFCLLAPIAGVFCYWLSCYMYGRRLLKSVPSPMPWPILGNAMLVGSFRGILHKLPPLFKQYNTKLLHLNIGPKNLLMIQDYKFLEFLLSSNEILVKSVGYTFLRPWLGTGLLTGDGEKWRQRRKMLTPSFHFSILEDFVEVFETGTNVLVEKLKKEVAKGSTDVFPLLALCTLDIICESAMGTSMNAQENKDSLYVKSVNSMCRIIQERSFSVILHLDFFYKFTELYKEQQRSVEVMLGYTKSVVSRRRAELQKKTEKREEQVEDDVGTKKRKAFLDLLLDATIDGVPLSDEDICEEVNTLMFAGHDTTATAMSFVLFALAKYPEEQQKVHQEIVDVLEGDLDRPMVYKDLQNFKYMDMFIKEALRLWPPVPIYMRNVHKEIKYGDITLPKNATLSVFAYGLHRDPEFFPHPDRFIPERFAPDLVVNRQPYAFIPFSAGPRNCIGQKFAMLEMKYMTAKILKNFVLEPVVPEHNLDLIAQTVMTSTNGVLVKFENRRFS